MSENQSSRYQKKNRFADFFSQYLGGEILLTEKFSKWYLYIGLLIGFALLFTANENLIKKKEKEIRKLETENKKLRYKKSFDAIGLKDTEEKLLKTKIDELGLKKAVKIIPVRLQENTEE